MRSALQRLLPALAIFAMAAAQVLGVHHGYVCDHQGLAITVTHEHCHPESDATKGHLVPCSESETSHCEDHRETHKHPPHVDDLTAMARNFLAITAPGFVVGAVMDIPRLEGQWLQRKALARELSANGDTTNARTWACLQVAKCIVIQV